MADKAKESMPVRIRADELKEPLKHWLLPEVGSSHTVGLHAKEKPRPADVSVVEEEIVAEKVTLAELEQIRETAHQEGFEAGKAEGYDFGRSEGAEKGYAEGLEKAQAEIDQQLEKLDALLQAFDKPLYQQHDELVSWVTELAIQIAETVMREQVSVSSDVLTSSLQACLDQLPDASGALKVLLHPDDVQWAEPLLSAQPRAWSIVEDAGVMQGGCRVLADQSVANDLLDQRFSTVVEELRGRLKSTQLAEPEEGELDGGE